jgi:AAA+ superfamily predicted ATPase
MKNHWLKDQVGQNERFRTELVQLTRLAVLGDRERLKIQVMRLIRMLRHEGDGMAEVLQSAMFPGDTKDAVGSATRAAGRGTGSSMAMPLPFDDDNQADILRIEDDPAPSHALVRNPRLTRAINQLVAERKAVERLRNAGLDAPSAVLFTGPPGVGKTETAREIAAKLEVPLVILDLATVISSLLGKTGNNVKRAFDYARRMPCVFFLDEVDAVAKRRDDSGDVGELKRLVTVLLQELDLWPSGNLLIAATNHAHLLDPAVLRRFHQTLAFTAPTREELLSLGAFLGERDGALPSGWMDVLAELAQGTSHSGFIRDLNRVRRTVLLRGRQEGKHVIREVAAERSPDLGKDSKKRVATVLVEEIGISKREASRLTGLARDTVNSALHEASNI